MKYLEFDCGCKIPILSDREKQCDGLPSLDLDYEQVPENCPLAWSVFEKGDTKGVFQLENNLGMAWAARVIPNNLNQLAALVAIIRPGSLQSIVDGKSMTQLYAERKNGVEEVKYFHEALEPILKDTFGVMAFQEQAMKIATDIAGFSLQEADNLRKAIGKKLPEVMAKIKPEFIEKAVAFGKVNRQEAETIFGWIEEAQKYAFNKCILDTTTVTTPNGDVQIKDLKIGDKVLSPGAGNNEFVEVVNKYDNGEQEVVKITLADGKEICCTMEHKFLSEAGRIVPLKTIIKDNLGIATLGKPSKIKYYKNLGKLPTVDIEVNHPRHLYYANGIATSNSHSVTYGKISYWTAWVKSHFPLHFYTAWLYYAVDKQFSEEEIEGLVEDCYGRDIDICPPTLSLINNENSAHFFLDKEKVYFGLSDIKGLGVSEYNKLKNAVVRIEKDLGKGIEQWNWFEFLIHLSDNVSMTVINGLVMSGAADYLGKSSRARKLLEYSIWRDLSDKEKDYIRYSKVTSIEESIEIILGDSLIKVTEKRRAKLLHLLNSLKSSAYSTEDTITTIIKAEKQFLGLAVTCSNLDACNTVSDTKCSDISSGKRGKVNLAVEIVSVRGHTIKKEGPSKGKKMAFLKLRDDSGFLECVVFSDKLSEFSSLLFKGNTVLLECVASDKNGSVSVIVNGAKQI